MKHLSEEFIEKVDTKLENNEDVSETETNFPQIKANVVLDIEGWTFPSGELPAKLSVLALDLPIAVQQYVTIARELESMANDGFTWAFAHIKVTPMQHRLMMMVGELIEGLEERLIQLPKDADDVCVLRAAQAYIQGRIDGTEEEF